MSYGEVPEIAALGETADGLPEIVQFEYNAGRTVTATYEGINDRGINGDEVVYEIDGRDTPVAMLCDAVDDAYDVIERVGEREGYRDAPDWAEDDLDSLPMDDQQDDRRTVDEILADDTLDPLF